MPIDGEAPRQTAGEEPLAQLRAILLGPDRAAWETMRQRLDNPERRAQDVAGVLAEAVRLRSDAKLRRALQPLLEDAIQRSVQANPKMLADALFPIFGKAIRRAITAELDGMLQSLSQMLEQSFSLRSLSWRWESFRTGKPYSEVVILRSLLFRVEQVFLIHRASGLLLEHVSASATTAKDPEMVSGMLTAIQDFVRDSVSVSEKENLETIRMGEVGVVLAYGPDAILAGFVRGVAPRNLNALFQDTLDTIEQKYSEALHDFQGNTLPFDVCRPRLQALLVGQGGAGERISTSRGARALMFGAPAAIVLAVIAWLIYTSAVERRWDEYTHRLQREPGIVVTHAEKRGGKFYVAGLRDPLAADPAALLPANVRAADLDPHWEQYHSLAPQFASRRKLEELKSELERRAFRFTTGHADIPPEQRFLLEDVASEMIALIQAGNALGANLQVEVRGNHDPMGTEEFNSALARSRGENTRAALVMFGVPAARIIAAPEDLDKETCSAVNEDQRLFCRSASFRVRDLNQR